MERIIYGDVTPQTITTVAEANCTTGYRYHVSLSTAGQSHLNDTNSMALTGRQRLELPSTPADNFAPLAMLTITY